MSLVEDGHLSPFLVSAYLQDIVNLHNNDADFRQLLVSPSPSPPPPSPPSPSLPPPSSPSLPPPCQPYSVGDGPSCSTAVCSHIQANMDCAAEPASPIHSGTDGESEEEGELEKVPLRMIALSVVEGLQPEKVFRERGDYLYNIRSELRKIARQR